MEKEGKVLVTGAGGFVGKNVVSQLLVHGWRVKAMIRKRRKLHSLQNKKLEIMCADMCNLSSLKNTLKGVCSVVHLAAAMSDEINSDDVNVEGAKRLILACKGEGCKRVINISTQSAKIKRKGTYARTKKEAEIVLHSSELHVTSLRPSIIYGEEELGVFGKIVKFVKVLPLVPVLGDGKWITAPIYIEDVSKAIIACIENENTIGKMYDLGGPDRISFDDLIGNICNQLDISRPIMHIPFGLSLIIAKIASKIFSQPPFTVSNVLGSNQQTNLDINPARMDFGFDPVNLKTGLRKVLGKNQKINR